jgi:hypothetical protein
VSLRFGLFKVWVRLVFVHEEPRYALQFEVKYLLLIGHHFLAIEQVHFSIIKLEI